MRRGILPSIRLQPRVVAAGLRLRALAHAGGSAWIVRVEPGRREPSSFLFLVVRPGAPSS